MDEYYYEENRLHSILRLVEDESVSLKSLDSVMKALDVLGYLTVKKIPILDRH